ncbi:iron-sulfur cluster insertion protein ErpA [Solimonas terrae]|uniref:Iron-sulfur cluster insertion protein ErpA n=1 Tax=Solimonas terrae TaxID=1396819 RepID=A0A6M2BT13_9GAMM|nr:iron-sulfur cluster insertion protein ErpA [Solimonas terrae]NGY05504.1 iron-sulfur cluster insertion protein ErpA [Solimonas terrae]
MADVETVEQEATVIFTAAAADKVRELLDDEDDREQKLRVFVTGGGCSGFQYGFKFDKSQEEDDTVVTRNGVTLLVDPMSVQYLMGAEIDYKESVEGAQFVIRNPNASTTCGCGNSFSV